MSQLRELTVTITTDGSFTGQTQNVVAGQTGIYDFLFRQHSAAQGRWLVPDPAGLAAVDLTNPQTWNRYAYVANNPLGSTDPLGLSGIPTQTQFTTGCGQDASCWNVYRDNVMWAHQGGVNEGPAANWGALDSLSFTHVTTTSVTDTTGLLGLPTYHPSQLTISPDGYTFYQTLGGWSSATSATTEAATLPYLGTLTTPSYSASGYIPFLSGVGGYTFTYTKLQSPGQPTYNCYTHAATVSTPNAKIAVSGGPLYSFGKTTTEMENVINSWGWNFSLQATPQAGWQVNINSSGAVGGQTFGIPGASVSYGHTNCN